MHACNQHEGRVLAAVHERIRCHHKEEQMKTYVLGWSPIPPVSCDHILGCR